MKHTHSGRSRGFTLIELLVVIAIIGLLSSVVLASLNGARIKSRDTRRLADLKQLQVALELYYSTQSTPGYPAELSSLAPTFISALPTDPQTGSSYTYAVGTNSGYYCMGATLESTVPAPADSCNGAANGISTEPVGNYRVGP